ncbi:MFS general substrate transporter [Coniochaeta ligniaria NRRL 30616]|uniref:MFS general substrate transporter n=1 Tax=Coniochaeta ligniaria NRRL 30616 TaxID=1408157 RepID=A0A1J7ISY6_9PEZI|nr:MFS general substrate transporter [Coniochaeta ligniaria NRRL 30616]
MDVPIPGTVHLVDVLGTSHLRHEQGEKDIILVPQPTDDPNDPLNWSPRRRLNSSIWQMVWALSGAAIINALPPAYLLIQEETGIAIGDLNTGNALMYLFFGFGTLLSQPFALNFGRRPTAVFSLGITSFLVLWASYMKTTGEWYANRILTGIFFSTIESLIELCVADTKFSHERGFHMGFYTWALFGGAFLAPIPAGFLADAAGWRWINKMYCIIGVATTVAIYFGFEETMFYRHNVVDEFLDERADDTLAPVETVEPALVSEGKEAISDTSPSSDSEAAQSYAVHGYAHRLKLWGHRDPRQPNTFLKFFFIPFYLMRYPSIVFSGLLVGCQLAWYNVLLGTITSVFGEAPYNFSSNMIGLTYLACFIGTSIGCLLAGWLNDRIATWVARKNNGIKEPEARLWVAIIPMIIHPAGCILFGVGGAHHIHWVGVCFGIIMVTTGIVMGATLALSYAVDCYKEIAGEAIITVIIIRNIIGFAFGYAVVPMVDSLGLQNTFILIAFLGVALTSLCFVMIAFGKGMRKSTAVSYWKLVEEHGFQAH